MKKTMLSITPRQDTVYRALAQDLEISLSELVRRALDKYIEDLLEEGALGRDVVPGVRTVKKAS